ncbi:alpha/beta hydrolase [Flavobacterium enshiense]|uniref:alpha/beta hydrolase n=1 Tax=Flavobacterium enshiense TaxID=1341165 RepID=UPI003F580EA7
MKRLFITKIFTGFAILFITTTSCKKSNDSSNNSNTETMETMEKTAVHDFATDPNLSVGTKAFLKVLNTGGTPLEEMSKEDARNVLVNAQAAIKVDLSGIEESEKTIDVDGHSIKLNIVRPKDKKEQLPVFIFIHGGGWILGDYPTHKRLVRDLVVLSGYAAVFVNYTPSPEAKYPKAINEIYAASKWVAEHGNEINVDGKNMAIVGNSVGGNMVAATTLTAKEKNGPKFKVQVLLWPVTDAGFQTESYKKFATDRFLTASVMKWMFDQYTTDPNQRKEIYVSPLQATTEQLKGLPPTLIQVAENDILRDEGEAFGRKLDQAGVVARTVRYNGTIHDFGLLNALAEEPNTRTMLEHAASELIKYLK